MPFCALAQQHYTIAGTVKNVKSPAITYLYYQEDGKMHKDSAVVVDGIFKMQGTVGVPLKAFVLLAQGGKNINYAPNPDQVGIYLENGTINVEAADSLVNAKISGTPLNMDQQAMVDALFGFNKIENQLNAAYKNAQGKEDEMAKIKKSFLEMNEKRESAREAYINSHLNSLVSLNLLRATVNPNEKLERAQRLFAKLTPEVQTTKAAVAYQKLMNEAKALTVGGTAPDFTLKNVDDVDVSLSSFKGKYVLIDFWASWCVPCRKENPNVIRAFKQFKDKNFTVLGVSLDGGNNAKDKWTKAIEADGLSWEQVSDLQGWNSAVAKMYKVTSIPANFLLDPNGKIIGRNLQGKELTDKLSQVL